MSDRVAIKLAYLGQNYFGFQRQKGKLHTVEGSVIKVLQELEIIKDLTSARYNAAGRTDRGVNALEQVMAFDSLKEKIYLEEINQHLPSDIFVYAMASVNKNFSARRDAIRRTYRYFYPYNEQDLELMKKALKKLEGNNNFINLCKKPVILPSGFQKSTILTLEKAELNYLERNNLIQFEFTSKSFLWNQVRKMVSLILDIGSGIIPIEFIDEVLNSKERKNFGIKANNPEGLILYKVEYENIKFKTIKKKSIILNQIQRRLNSYSAISQILSLMKDSI